MHVCMHGVGSFHMNIQMERSHYVSSIRVIPEAKCHFIDNYMEKFSFITIEICLTNTTLNHHNIPYHKEKRHP